ncbi:MAG TPA: ECF transporter S component [Bacilli bacterium]|nr:ECF transporter S component [Bacilli bacterium]HPV69771.1 ECF transporter S component [Bacilli bacterium]
MKNAESKLIYQMIAIAMGVALSVLLTSFVFVPLPLGGFLNFTDVFIVLYSMFFGPWIGGAVGALSGLLVDIILGYGFYAPFTFFIKLIEGLVVGYFFMRFPKKIRFIAPFIGGIVMAGLYILPDFLLLQNWIAALTNFAFNLIQGVIGASLGIGIYLVLLKAKVRPPTSA